MLAFLANNIEFILTLICAIVVCIWLARRGQLAKIKQIILSLCVDAEITYGGGTGEIKKSSVLQAVYDLLPGWAKLLISGSTLSKLVEDGKTQMDELADGNATVMSLLYDTVTETADDKANDETGK